MHDYRRGLLDGTWQKCAHFTPDCPNYPGRNFQIQRKKPDDDELCSRRVRNSSRDEVTVQA